ncbi:hypothetical protein [Cerasicoccus maritimus]|uniref:hypothetical protein n=1 Tax=Cerasicoccus maritimus TaxID=490089 RepID=UPI002852657E|nr:hypothetical protein [Cerasicoccus maritimus]
MKRFLPSVKFAVEVNAGAVKPYARKPLPSAFLAAVHEQVEHGKLASGVIYGVVLRGGLTLDFSPGFPQAARQPLLNSWHIHKQRWAG